MKRLKTVLCSLAAVLLMTGCQDQVQQISGAYSYKISGTAVVDDTEYRLADEQGAMEVVRLNGDSALLTFNALLGQAYTAKALIDGKQLTIAPYERHVTVGVNGYTVTATGEGTAYDGTLVITLHYNSAEVSANSLTLLCKKN